MHYLSQENVGIRDDKVAIREELALSGPSRRKKGLCRMNASSTASNTTTDIVSQISFPEHCHLSVRKTPVIKGLVSTLDNLAPRCLFEKLPLGYHSLRARSLTDRDFDHRQSCGETRVRQVPDPDHRSQPTHGVRRLPNLDQRHLLRSINVPSKAWEQGAGNEQMCGNGFSGSLSVHVDRS